MTLSLCEFIRIQLLCMCRVIGFKRLKQCWSDWQICKIHIFVDLFLRNLDDLFPNFWRILFILNFKVVVRLAEMRDHAQGWAFRQKAFHQIEFWTCEQWEKNTTNSFTYEMFKYLNSCPFESVWNWKRAILWEYTIGLTINMKSNIQQIVRSWFSCLFKVVLQERQKS